MPCLNVTIPARPRPPFAAVALISAAALGYEILLIRLYSIIQWHHFAYMIISLSLLGFGASGTVLWLIGPALLRRFSQAFAIGAVLFGLSAVGCFAAAQRLPFNPLAIFWDPMQGLWLLSSYVLLMIPFFFAAGCIGLALLRFRHAVGDVYGFDLAGAGLGTLFMIFLLYLVPVETALRLAAAAGLGAAAAVVWRDGSTGSRRMPILFLGVGALVVAGMPSDWLTPRISQYKGLSQALEVHGAEVLERRSSPLGALTVVRNERVPVRHAPGLSLAAPVVPPEQLGVYTDGGALSVINRYDGDPASVAYLDYLTSAAPFYVASPQAVLVLGAGGGTEVLQALRRDALRIDAVEVNPQMVSLVRDRFAQFAGEVYDAPGVTVFVEEARGFVAGQKLRYDLIELALLDSFAVAAAGVHGLSESYLYTVQALAAYLERLKPEGILALTRWARLPPRDGPKLFATAVAALSQAGAPDPGAQLAWIRSWNTTTLLVKRGVWTKDEIEALRAFCEARSFDVAWYPGMTRQQANRFNRLDRPYYYEAARALLGPASGDFLERYKFRIEPATDDRPYFLNFFKWRTFPELLALGRKGGAGLLDLGYPILIATLVQAALASAVLILLPLLVRRRRRSEPDPGQTVRSWRVVGYFGAIGLGFMFLEIAFIQKLTLFLAHPVYAVAVVLTGFLVFAGLGSRRAGAMQTGWLSAWIAGFAIAYLLALPTVLDWCIGWPDPAKVLLALLVIAPLAFPMGMPFPRGLAALARSGTELVPWAWAINGCASVVGAVLATVLAVQFGFTAVVVCATLLYVCAGLLLTGGPAPAR